MSFFLAPKARSPKFSSCLAANPCIPLGGNHGISIWRTAPLGRCFRMSVTQDQSYGQRKNKMDEDKNALLAAFPNIRNSAGRSMLYIGASAWRAVLLEDFRDWGWRIDVLEIFPVNTAFVAHAYRPRKVIEGDVRQADSLLTETYDAVVWWHGPEHIPREDLPATLASLEQHAPLVILSCPVGSAPQGEIYGNPHEAHLWDVYPHDLENLGYSVKAFTRTSPGADDAILAWKIS